MDPPDPSDARANGKTEFDLAMQQLDTAITSLVSQEFSDYLPAKSESLLQTPSSNSSPRSTLQICKSTNGVDDINLQSDSSESGDQNRATA